MIKQIVKDCLAQLNYLVYRAGIKKCKIKVHTVDETIDELLHTNKSMVRFGDGEITAVKGKSITLQQVNPEIAEGLKRILFYPNDDLIVTIPEIFGDLSVYRRESRQFWKEHLLFYRRVYEEYCNPDRVYYSTSVSRFYYAAKDKRICDQWVMKLKEIWRGRDVVVVEGERTHNGVGNDLLETAKSVERIIGPSSNAFERVDEIVECCRDYPKDRLFLISLGVAAKFLTEELVCQGYRALDIGNLDMEYEWYLQRASGKTEIAKHRITTREGNEKAGYQSYLQQIRKRIV